MMSWIKPMIQNFGYPGLALAVTLECLYPPIPSEVILPFAGFLVGQRMLTLAGSILAATAGSVISGLVFYAIGRFVPKQVLFAFVGKHRRWIPVSDEELEQAFEWFSEKGAWAVLVGRIVPMVREFISIPAGLAEMPVMPFIAFTAVGSSIWNAALIGSGMLLGAHWESVQLVFAKYQYVAVLALAMLAFLVVAWRKGLLRKSLHALSSMKDRIPAPRRLVQTLSPLVRRSDIISMALVACLVLTFGHIADDVHEKEFWNLDLSVAQRIFESNSPSVDVAARLGGLLASPLLIVPMLVVVGLYGRKRGYEGLERLLVALAGSLLSSELVKLMFQRPRPIWNGVALDTGFSFPSSHTAVGAAFYGALAYVLAEAIKSKQLKCAVLLSGVLAAGLVAVSRVYLGVHYPSDVLAGMAFGFAWSILSVEGVTFVERRRLLLE